ncbi:MAG: Spheroidene monooxygenase [Pseudomonadota bacterium]|jgi:spheroidene monooxygenase
MSLEEIGRIAPPLSGVVLILLVDYMRQHQGWGWLRLMSGTSGLRDVPGLRFAKVMGSGQGGGFSLRPSASHQGIIACFDTWAQASRFMQGPWVGAVRERARESWVGILSVLSARGQWDQQVWHASSESALEGAPVLQPGPLAVLTRASIRPAKAMAFWRHAPAAQQDLLAADGCDLAMGLGEAPLLRQCTFSVWRDSEAMRAYAHQSSHLQAIQAAYKHQFFSESLFVHFRPLYMQGQCKGHAVNLGDPAWAQGGT